MRTLLHILVCPACKGELVNHSDRLTCPACAADYPIVNGVPVFLPGVVPEFERELPVRPGYSAWKERCLATALRRDQIGLDFGCGYQSVDDPNLIRMDASLHPYVDVVGDVHHLPFRDNTIHIAFGGAVFEHLQEPRRAASELWRCLAPGGYLYADWNFVFAYHGFPAHYFNASIDGVREVFARFRLLETGVAPFQGPGAALRQVIGTYLENFAPRDAEGQSLRETLETLLLYPLEVHDRSIAAGDRHRIAAGIFVVAVKDLTGHDSILAPALLARWEHDESLRRRFPEPRHIAQVPNILTWAEGEGKDRGQSQGQGLVDPPASSDLFAKDGRDRPRHEAFAAWPKALLSEFEPAADTELRRVMLRRKRPLSRKARDLFAKPSDVIALPARVVRHLRWRVNHLMGRTP